jgi:hypothetical protein
MFIRQDLISAQFKLKNEISYLHSQAAAMHSPEETTQLNNRLKSLEEKLSQVKMISKF